MACCAAAPAPDENTKGKMPEVNAIEVIKIGRKRISHALSAASNKSIPWSCMSFANSIIKIAFFAAKPIMVIKPTLKYTSFGIDAKLAAIKEPNTPKGTTKITAKGIDQLSYKAAKHKKIASKESASSIGACEPEILSSLLIPVHS